VRVPPVDLASSGQLQELVDTFTENEKHYRMAIALYEQRLARLQPPTKIEANFKHLFEEKRTLEKQNNSYASLIANFPAFTRLFKDNLELRKRVKQLEEQLAATNKAK